MKLHDTIDVLIGGYLSKEAAEEDYDAVLNCGAHLQGMALVAKDLEGELSMVSDAAAPPARGQRRTRGGDRTLLRPRPLPGCAVLRASPSRGRFRAPHARRARTALARRASSAEPPDPRLDKHH
jgi:hypothetical protein